MKELTIEEKATRYDKAIDVARKINSGEGVAAPSGWTTCEVIFPELKENEDEKIREGLIGYFRAGKCENISSYHGISTNDILAWLEKQGEQKTADKIEPKFKVGDWVVQENIGIYKVIEVCESWYEVVDSKDKHYSIGFDKEFMCHLWTIADAKDGDVLICPKYANDIIQNIFIFKNIKTKDNDVFCYCSFLKTFMTGGYVANADPINTDFYPATKEQRDILLKAISDAGYTFDFNNKRLSLLRP